MKFNYKKYSMTLIVFSAIIFLLILVIFLRHENEIGVEEFDEYSKKVRSEYLLSGVHTYMFTDYKNSSSQFDFYIEVTTIGKLSSESLHDLFSYFSEEILSDSLVTRLNNRTDYLNSGEIIIVFNTLTGQTYSRLVGMHWYNTSIVTSKNYTTWRNCYDSELRGCEIVSFVY